ncbi:MAG: zinc-dependent metalloprotease [Polyangiaceae bacterium]
MRSTGRIVSAIRASRAVIALALCSSIGGGGCMEERAPINRVQPGAVAKSFFVGDKLADASDDPEFYWRNYVVDGSASQSLLGVGSWGNVDRIRWEITEDMLIAHKAYAIAQGEDDKGGPGAPDGTIVAAFAITSHFDIKRAYNPTTGEEMNIVEENTVDVPPLQRGYMRVDWSRNLVDSPAWDDMFIGKLFGNVKVSPVSYDVTDPANPDRPHFEMENGYFDITMKYLLAPEESYIPGIPTCALVGFYTGSTTYECNEQEATVRSSFVKVDPNRDFEPLEITHAPLDVVGNPGGLSVGSLQVGLISGVKQGWDPGYGFVDALYHRYAHLHNIWKQSHQSATCATNDDTDQNGTADACENAVTGYAGNTGSQCDVAVGKCTIPYRDRELSTVGYWVNDKMLPELQDPVDESGNPTGVGAAEDIIASWDQLMSNAVARSREVECRRTGGERAACEAEFFEPEQVMLRYGAWLVGKPKETVPVLTLCHNPVRSYDRHDVCGETGEVARLGDIRKNFFAYWPYESRAPWGGIGNWGGDPLDGEIHGAAAMVMGRSVTYAAARQRDVIQLALGDITVEEVTDGVPAENYVKELREGSFAPALTSEQIDSRVAQIDANHVVQTVAPTPVQGASVAEQYRGFTDMMKATTVDPALHGATATEFDALVSPLRGSVYESQLVDQQWMVDGAALAPDTATSDVMDMVSPLRGLDPGARRAIHHDLEAMLETRGVCFHENEAPVFGSVDLQGLAKYYKDKYPDGQYDAQTRGEAIYKDLVVEAFKGIAIHEVGHSLGLLHNFTSSWDALNFHPQYWQLRTQEGKAAKSCDGKPRTGDTVSAANDKCMGPRYLDPSTDDEQGLAGESRPGVDYFGQTSVMEYAIERFGETVGLGQYDAHAMKALYGRVLETFEDEEHGGFSPIKQMDFAPLLETQLSDEDRIFRSTAPFAGQKFAKPTHYTEAARLMKVFDPSRCRDATDEEKAIAGFRLVHGKVCAPPPKDHAAWADFEDAPTQSGVATSVATAVKTRDGVGTGGGHVRWMYRYGSSSNSYFHTNPGDAGADPYEVTVNAVKKFDGAYPWAYFRRHDREFDARGLPSAVAHNTIERLRSYHWAVANGTAFYKTFGDTTYEEIANADDWHRPSIMAEHEMFNAYMKMLLTPEPGQYAATAGSDDTGRTVFDAVSSGGKFALGAGDARFIGEEFNSDPNAGGSWNYTSWMRHAGFGVEKTYAMMALADARPTLSTISRANYLDGRDVRINFRSDMPEAVDRLLGGVLSEDWTTVGMWVPSNEQTPVPEVFDLTTIETAPARPDGARVLFPNVGYRQQLGMLIFANLYSRYGTDMQLTNKLRVWIDGSQEQVNVPEAQRARFYDPASGYTYIARRYGGDLLDGKIVDRGIASRMVAHANDLVAKAYAVEKDAQGKPVLDAQGLPKLVLDADGLPVVEDSAALGKLTKYVGLLDAARQIGHDLGYGPLGGGNGED